MGNFFLSITVWEEKELKERFGKEYKEYCSKCHDFFLNLEENKIFTSTFFY